MKKTSNPIRFDVGEEVRVTVLDSAILEIKNVETGKLERDCKTIPIVSLVPVKIGSLQAAFKLYDVQKWPDQEFKGIITGRHGRWEVNLDGTDGLVFIVGCAYRGYLTFLAEVLEQFGVAEYEESYEWNDVTNEEMDKDVWRHDLIKGRFDCRQEFDKRGELFEQYLESLAKEPFSKK